MPEAVKPSAVWLPEFWNSTSAWAFRTILVPVLSTEKIAPAPKEPLDEVEAELTAEFRAATVALMLEEAATVAETEVPLMVSRTVWEAVLAL
ncbi:hypothetical protein [Methylobacterium mesophilicum]|uniref:hypothetical protein n=1 Tax=Methylobacterium mesophilicum TaxID=39956 RepID=UPI003AF83501